MGYQNYDDWKLANPYDECEDEFVHVDVEVAIFDLGQNVINAFKNETSKISFEDDVTTLTTTIQVEARLTCDDFEKECYVEEYSVKQAVYDVLGKDCDYEILNWETARQTTI